MWLILVIVVTVAGVPLHEHMEEEELQYYFQTPDKQKVPEYQVVYLDTQLPEEEEVEYGLTVFDRPINLKLKRNTITSPAFKTYIHDEQGVNYFNETPTNCHYLHQEDHMVAALSLCGSKTVQGLIFADNSTFEIQPLTNKLQRLHRRSLDGTVPHLVKRARFASDLLLEDLLPTSGIFLQTPDELYTEPLLEQRRIQPLTLELALFFDEAAYKIFSPYFKYDDKKLQNMLLAYVNGVQALYHHPSLGVNLELVLVRLDIMKKQPRDMPHYNGERSQLLDSFCQYQAGINPKGDANPEHWDMGLYVSGLDFYAYDNGKKSGVTMGLATVGGVCLDKYACIIAEFGTTNVFGKPYPSAGFTSVYILAHEIGHNLGMHHDSSGNSCPKDGYIMSPSRGTNGETQWSYCSAQIMAKLDWAKCLKDSSKPDKNRDHSRFLDIPGRIYTAKRQCEVLLRDKDALASPSQQQSDICYSLQCKTPHRSGYYNAGPALDGTPCGGNRYCYGGHCTSKQPPKPIKATPGGWSDWKPGQCSSGCIEQSTGMQVVTRQCNNPTPINTDEGCEGSSRQFNLCKDSKICSSRKSAVAYASAKCREFSRVLPELDGKFGLQAPHEDGRLWTSCAIFCKRKDSGAFYTPRIELNDLGLSPYFPDGTLCHNDRGINYYCMQHHCLPEDFKFSKIGFLDDLPFSQNARPNRLIPPNLESYFSLSPNGRPVQTTFKIGDTKDSEEEWETKDYVELPSLEARFKAVVQQINDLEFV